MATPNPQTRNPDILFNLFIFGEVGWIGKSVTPINKMGAHRTDPVNTPITSVAVAEKLNVQPWMPVAAKMAVNIRIGMGFDMVTKNVEVKAFNTPFTGCVGELVVGEIRKILAPKASNTMQHSDWIMTCF